MGFPQNNIHIVRGAAGTLNFFYDQWDGWETINDWTKVGSSGYIKVEKNTIASRRGSYKRNIASRCSEENGSFF